VKSALERLPHLAARVQALWGQTEFEPYVSRLVMESRDGQRQGLPWDVAQELFFLVELCVAKHALAAAEMTGASFREMFARCLARSADAILTGPTMTDCWSDPLANKDARRIGRRDAQPRRSFLEPARRKPMRNWWSRLLAWAQFRRGAAFGTAQVVASGMEDDDFAIGKLRSFKQVCGR